MDPMQNMAATLLKPAWPQVAPPRKPKAHGPGEASKTERLRAYLRDVGPATAVVLALEADLASTALVGALLKQDIQRGAVEFRASRYCWVQQFDWEVQADLKAAARLLRRHGWRVQRPKDC
jgi:hypothetical protein